MWPINSRSSIYLYQFHVDYLVLVIVSPFWTNSIRFASTGRGLSGLAHLWRTMSAVQGLSRLAWRSPAHRLAGVRAVLCRGRWASARVAPPRLKRRHPDRARGDGEEGVTAADSSLRQPGASRATCAYGDLRAGRHASWCLPRLPWGGGCCVVAVCGATAGVVVRASSPLLPRRPVAVFHWRPCRRGNRQRSTFPPVVGGYRFLAGCASIVQEGAHVSLTVRGRGGGGAGKRRAVESATAWHAPPFRFERRLCSPRELWPPPPSPSRACSGSVLKSGHPRREGGDPALESRPAAAPSRPAVLVGWASGRLGGGAACPLVP